MAGIDQNGQRKNSISLKFVFLAMQDVSNGLSDAGLRISVIIEISTQR